VNHPHAAFPKAILKAIRAESPRESFGRWHRAFQCTKQIGRWGAGQRLPLDNVAGRTGGRDGG
jgi:hypothetical protein